MTVLPPAPSKDREEEINVWMDMMRQLLGYLGTVNAHYSEHKTTTIFGEGSSKRAKMLTY